MAIDFLFDGPADAATNIALAHGAGAAMDTPFMDGIAARLGAAGLRVARFEFPYMAKRRDDGRKRGPDRPDVLLATWHTVANELGSDRPLIVAGKSMGGRYASLYAAAPEHMPVAGIVALGYPFHPPGKPDRLRTDHLSSLAAPMLIVQGERDSFGNRDEVAGYALPVGIRIAWAPDGDHSLKPRKTSGHTEAGNLDIAAAEIVRFATDIAD
ncbi:MAG: alpha/beta family hydrolase [Alphaproteobacteria bacterium]